MRNDYGDSPFRFAHAIQFPEALFGVFNVLKSVAGMDLFEGGIPERKAMHICPDVHIRAGFNIHPTPSRQFMDRTPDIYPHFTPLVWLALFPLKITSSYPKHNSS